MGDMGGDFSSLMIPLFHEIIMERIQIKLNVCLTHFKSIIATERWGIGGDVSSQTPDSMDQVCSNCG